MTVGPWKPVSLEVYNVRITDLRATATVGEDFSVKLNVSLALSERVSSHVTVSLKTLDGKSILAESGIHSVDGTAEAHFSFEPGAVELWYPTGYGKQSLYVVEVEVSEKVLQISFDTNPPLILCSSYCSFLSLVTPLEGKHRKSGFGV